MLNLLLPVIIYTTKPICTVSLNFPPATKFTYAKDLIVLDVPEYNNATTKTAGIPTCRVGKVVIGYSNKKFTSGFALDMENNFIKY